MKLLLALALAVMAPLAPAAAQQVPTTTPQLVAALRANPDISRMRTNDPQAFAELARLLDEAEREAIPFEQLQARVLALFNRVLDRKLPRVSDEQLVRWSRLGAEQVDALAASRPEMCNRIHHGGGTPEELIPLLPPELVARERVLNFEIITAPPGAEQRLASDEEIADMVGPALDAIADQLGVTSDEVGAAFEGEGPALLQCRVASAFVRLLIGLPPEQGIPILRRLSTDEVLDR